MVMFKCNDCGRTFEEPKEYRESRGEFWGFPAYETIWLCPCCGGQDFEEYREYVYEDEW